ncbi:hypothetical protein A6R72_11295 [Xanthomonas translucens pv. graminis]|nr:hypothetical protein A6R72_11295 [Xanthomonas translucens pv. graminis]
MTDCEKPTSGDWLRLMMLRAVSSRTCVRSRGAANSSLSSGCQPSSSAWLMLRSKRPGRWLPAPRPLMVVLIRTGYAGTVAAAATATQRR